MLLDPEEEKDALRYLEQYRFLASVKIGYLGSQQVGCRTFILRAIHGDKAPQVAAYDAQDPASNPNHDIAVLPIAGGKNVHLEVERIACRAGYEALFKLIVEGCEAFVFLYNVASRQSFEEVQQFYQRVCEVRDIDVDADVDIKAQESPSPVRGCLPCFGGSLFRRAKDEDAQAGPKSPKSQERPPMLLVANKIDEPDASWQVRHEEGRALAQKIGADFVEVSAKTGQGCDKLLESLALRVISRRKLEASQKKLADA